MAKTKRLIEDASHNFEIANEDILLYAQQIGIDIKNEKHLMWIAKEGLSADVPEPWLIYSDEQDRVFYYNTDTREKSWCHPLDKEYTSLVSEERTKSKSLNSASSDYGFESKLSSLADAPPLSSSGKNTPPSTKLGRNDGGLSSKKIEFGQIENRRRTQLAPVRLNTLKMPVPTSQKSGLGGMSFMPKGATLSRNARRMKEETDYSDSHLEERLKYVPPNDDSNESLNSDEGSKYSYEESDEEEKHIHGLEPYDLMDTSQLSPAHSADESPDALEINSLVQLGTKMPLSLDYNKKREPIESSLNKENSPSLNLRKVGQPSFLKPLTQASKKKGSFKESKLSKRSLPSNKYPNEEEVDFEDKISVMNEEQRLMIEQIQREWLKMQNELEKQEKEKYEEMIKISSMKLEEEKEKLKSKNSETISKIKSELQKKIEDEEILAEKSLQTLKLSKDEKINEEKEKLQKELEAVTEALKTEIKMMEEKKAMELSQKQKEIEEASKIEIEKLELVHSSNKKNIEDAQLVEISNLQENHRQKMDEIQNELKREENEAKNKINSETPKHEEQKEYKDIKELIQVETEKYNNLLIEKENILSEIAAKTDNLEKLNTESSEAQKLIQELQDEVDKTENDLDLLRSEKSALISELSILKENIKNEKSNLLNLEQKVKLEYAANCSKEFLETGTNTHSTMIATSCKSCQISVSCQDVSCQIGNISSVVDTSCQASTFLATASKSSQVEQVSLVEEKQFSKNDRTKQNANITVDKTLEKALSGLGTKLDSRISVIEQQLKLLQENLSRPNHQVELSSQDFIQNQFTEIPSMPNTDNRNNLQLQSNDSSVQLGHYTNIPISSQNKCKCEIGDASSCDVMRDVKNSIYHLNDIVSQNFVPPLRESSFYQVKQPLVNYSTPFESFYAQVRDMQEKHRLTELKHKCENEVVKVTKSSSSNTNESARNFSDNEFSKSSQQSVQSNFYSDHVHDDPLIRARNLVLREQAKAWKQQQTLSSTLPNILSANMRSLDNTQSSFVGLSASISRTSLPQQSFYNLEIDPETDYNNWMKRLNALQLRIRSHKIL